MTQKEWRHRNSQASLCCSQMGETISTFFDPVYWAVKHQQRSMQLCLSFRWRLAGPFVGSSILLGDHHGRTKLCIAISIHIYIHTHIYVYIYIHVLYISNTYYICIQYIQYICIYLCSMHLCLLINGCIVSIFTFTYPQISPDSKQAPTKCQSGRSVTI